MTKLPENDRVVFGSTVTIARDDGQERTWRIVGSDEASVEQGTISFESPLGRSLIGRCEGEEAIVPAPSGQQVWEIVEVRYQ